MEFFYYWGTLYKSWKATILYYDMKVMIRLLTPTAGCSPANLSGFRIVQEFGERFNSAFLFRGQIVVVGILLIIHYCGVYWSLNWMKFLSKIDLKFGFGTRNENWGQLNLTLATDGWKLPSQKNRGKPCQMCTRDIYFAMKGRWNTFKFDL